MKIICPVKLDNNKGGAHHFLNALFVELEKMGVEIIYTDTPTNKVYPVFINSFLTPINIVKKFWNKGFPILLRLDGSAYAYGRIDDSDKIQEKICRYSDVIIYQSEFSQNILKSYGVTSKSGKVIFNGVDIDTFTPNGEKSKLIKNSGINILYASNSQQHLKGIREYIHLAHLLPKCNFYIASEINIHSLPYNLGGNLPTNITLLGRNKHSELCKILRTVDVFCSPTINDACPNIVLQAMASGTPIWHHDSGGIPEEVAGCGLQISDNPNIDIDFFTKNQTILSEKARNRIIENFTVEKSAVKYFEELSNLNDKVSDGKFKRTIINKCCNLLTKPKAYNPRIRVGYFLNLDFVNPSEYHRIRASAWIRCYQFKKLLKWYGVDIVIDPTNYNNLDLAIIMNRPTVKSVEIAKQLKQKNINFIFDMVTNTLDESKANNIEITTEDIDMTKEIISLSSAISSVSPWLADKVATIHKHSYCIPDAVPYEWYKKPTQKDRIKKPTLIYAGMATKTEGMVGWWEIAKDMGCELITLTEKPCESLIGAKFIKWNYHTFLANCQTADIALCPRINLDLPYNKAHSSFKVDCFLAQSIPVIASRVPSYLQRLNDNDCGFLVDSDDEFKTAISSYLSNNELLTSHSSNAQAKVVDQSTRHIVQEWNKFFRGILIRKRDYIL